MQRFWRPDETDTLRELFEQGLTRSVIAQRMNRPIGTIDSRLMALRSYRGIAPRKAWTAADIDTLIIMWEAGKSVYTIGAKLSRSKNAVERKYREVREDGTLHQYKKRKKREDLVLPVAASDWMQPLTRAQLMGRRA